MSKTQEIEDFKNLFPFLTPMQQEIWKYLHWFCRNYRCVKPSHAHIAGKVGCHRDTVIQAIKKFSELGWLGVIKKAWRTCTYFISEHLLRLDPSNKNTFRRPPPKPYPTENPTENPTHIKEVSIDKRNVGSDTVQFSKKLDEEIAFEVRDLPIPEHEKRHFSRYSTHILAKAIEDLRTYAKKYRVNSPVKLLQNRINEYLRQARQVKC